MNKYRQAILLPPQSADKEDLPRNIVAFHSEKENYGKELFHFVTGSCLYCGVHYLTGH